MTSTKFCAFWTPPPLSMYYSRNLSVLSQHFGLPPTPPSADVICEWPLRGAEGPHNFATCSSELLARRAPHFSLKRGSRVCILLHIKGVSLSATERKKSAKKHQGLNKSRRKFLATTYKHKKLCCGLHGIGPRKSYVPSFSVSPSQLPN